MVPSQKSSLRTGASRPTCEAWASKQPENGCPQWTLRSYLAVVFLPFECCPGGPGLLFQEKICWVGGGERKEYLRPFKMRNWNLQWVWPFCTLCGPTMPEVSGARLDVPTVARIHSKHNHAGSYKLFNGFDCEFGTQTRSALIALIQQPLMGL